LTFGNQFFSPALPGRLQAIVRLSAPICKKTFL